MAITLDLTHAPVLLTRFDGQQTLADVEDYIAQMRAVHDRREPYLTITWMRRYLHAADQTQRIGRWLKDTEEVTRKCCAGAAMISESAGFRFALAAIFLIKPMPCPYLVCGTWPEALVYVRAQAAKCDLYVPAFACPWLELA